MSLACRPYEPYTERPLGECTTDLRTFAVMRAKWQMYHLTCCDEGKVANVPLAHFCCDEGKVGNVLICALCCDEGKVGNVLIWALCCDEGNMGNVLMWRMYHLRTLL